MKKLEDMKHNKLAAAIGMVLFRLIVTGKW